MSENASRGLKVALGIAIALIIAVGAYAFTLHQDGKEMEMNLTEQKDQLLNDLNGSKQDLEVAISEKGALTGELEAEKMKIEELMREIETKDLNIKNLNGYVSKYNSLKKQMNALMEENDKLKVENKYLATSLDSTSTELKNNKMFSDSLSMQNTALANVVESAAVLNTAKLKAEGVIVRSSGKIIETDNASRVDKLKVCFTVTKNSLVAPGDKAFFVQILDPKGTVLGANEAVIFEEQTVYYSTISTFNYEAKDLDVCEYVSNNNKDFPEGTYKVNVFDRNRVVSTTSFTLD
jgi:regulator of replication initiation timing|tara:strand:- start:455 stop:1333 length:879 start_codon:yes stop_codon:yes gene_type:complete